MFLHQEQLLSPEDIAAADRPKKLGMLFGVPWLAAAIFLQQAYTQKAEWVYKRFLATPAFPLFVIAPFAAVFYYSHCQSKVYRRIYEKKAGHLSDRELLELEMRLNPGKAVVINHILANNSSE